MTPNANMVKCATANGAARVRRLANGFSLIHLADQETTVVVMNGEQLFDLTKCRRLSRGAAHRIVDTMTDADASLKALYHSLIDAKTEEVRK